MTKPPVTAVITTYNRVRYLATAIESVLRQSFKDFELLVLDNSSKDETPSVVGSYKDGRLRYVRHAQLNVPQARNLGVREAQGEYIAFLDDDDEWLPDKLDRQVAFFRNADSRVALVYGGFIRFDADGKEFHTHTPWQRGRVLRSLLRLEGDFTGSASNPMLRRKVVLELGGYDECVLTGEDWEFYLRLAEKYEVDFIPEPVVKIRHHFGPRVGARVGDCLDLERGVLKRFGYMIEKDADLHGFWLQRIGGTLVRLGRCADGREMIAKSIRCRPTNGITYIQYASSLCGQRFYQFCHRLYRNHKRTVKV